MTVIVELTPAFLKDITGEDKKIQISNVADKHMIIKIIKPSLTFYNKSKFLTRGNFS